MSAVGVKYISPFLKAKFQFSKGCGFDVSPDEIHPLLKPHQRDIVQWAVHRGRASILRGFGLGTVAYRALKLKRKGYGVELSPRYFAESLSYCQTEEQKQAIPSLFDLQPEESNEGSQVSA